MTGRVNVTPSRESHARWGSDGGERIFGAPAARIPQRDRFIVLDPWADLAICGLNLNLAVFNLKGLSWKP